MGGGQNPPPLLGATNRGRPWELGLKTECFHTSFSQDAALSFCGLGNSLTWDVSNLYATGTQRTPLGNQQNTVASPMVVEGNFQSTKMLVIVLFKFLLFFIYLMLKLGVI